MTDTFTKQDAQAVRVTLDWLKQQEPETPYTEWEQRALGKGVAKSKERDINRALEEKRRTNQRICAQPLSE
jgi:hypothetical protein